MRRHIILIGLPGAGKTTVGRLAARALGATFTDLDDVIAARRGKSIPRIFAEDGEPAFRALEAELGAETFAGPAGVIALGGGFVAEPARRRLALRSGVVVHLKTLAATAARRLAGSSGRPLLDGRDIPDRLTQLSDQREHAYLEAPHSVTTDELSPEQIAGKVVALARQQGGW